MIQLFDNNTNMQIGEIIGAQAAQQIANGLKENKTLKSLEVLLVFHTRNGIKKLNL